VRGRACSPCCDRRGHTRSVVPTVVWNVAARPLALMSLCQSDDDVTLEANPTPMLHR